jgi:AAA family ATP:ADP antiporter
MVRALERVLNLRTGEFRRGILLFAYLFLVITSYVVGKAARDALFLDRFQAVQLPYADFTVAVIVAAIVGPYIRLGRHLSLRSLLVGSLLFFAGNCVVFFFLNHYYDPPWLLPTIYVWMGVFGVLAPAQVWTLASSVLAPREAKRLFGLVGGGAIGGWIVGGFLTQVTATRFGTESSLLGMAAALAACAFLVDRIWTDSQQIQVGAIDFSETREEAPRGLRESLKLIRSSPYLSAIAAVICFSSFATSITGWQFKAIAKQMVPETDQLAAFFGQFNFYAGLASLLAQLLLTSRVLKHFGLGLALFIVPVSLTLGSLGVLFIGTLAAAVLLRGSDQVLRYSIDKTTVELLYLPVPAAQKVQVKSFIDTVVWRSGDGLGALAVLVFANQLDLTARQMSVVALVVLGGWITAAYVARRQYVTNLSESIHQHRLDAERASAPVLDRSTANVLAARLQSADKDEILYALGLFDMGHHQATHPAVRGLLHHPEPEVRQKAIAILGNAGDTTVLSAIEKLLYDESLEVRTEALLYLTHHAHVDPLERIEALGDFPDFSIRSAMVAFLARPGRAQNVEAAQFILQSMVGEQGSDGRRARLEAARLLALLPDHFDDQLGHLVRDRDPEIALHALKAVGRLKKRDLVLGVLPRLVEPALTEEATNALAAFGDRIVGTLRDHLSDPSVPIEIRRELPGVLLQIGTPAAEEALVENMLEADTTLRFRTISALNKIVQMNPNRRMDVKMVETVLAAEIMGHYRSYQIVGMLGGHLESSDPVVQALRDSMNQEVERIFRLLKILFPHFDLHSAYFGLQSTNPVVHDNALEFLESILKPQLRGLLVPLLDSEVSVAERVRLANRLVGAGVETQEEAVSMLLLSEDPWLKSCAAYAIGTLGLKSLEGELDKWVNAADPLLRETAKQAKEQLEGKERPA